MRQRALELQAIIRQELEQLCTQLRLREQQHFTRKAETRAGHRGAVLAVKLRESEWQRCVQPVTAAQEQKDSS